MCLVLNISAIYIIFLSVFTVYCPISCTTTLDVNEIAFFKTSDFPFLTDLTEFDDDISFILSDANITVKHDVYMLALIIEYGYCTYNENGNQKSNFKINFLSKKTSTFSLKSYIPSDPCHMHINPVYTSAIAYQGYVIFENSYENCPMESIMGNKYFQFINETQIIYLQSSYNENIFREKACHWRFSSPVGFAFKIVIEHFNVSASTEFYIKNTTDVIVNQRSIQLSHSLFNYDNFIEVYLSKDIKTEINDIEFQAYITIMKVFVQNSDGECDTFIGEEGTVTWSNYDYPNQLTQNNVYCNYTLIVKNNTEVLMVTYISLEGDSDIVMYYPDVDEEGVELYDMSQIMFAPYKNGTEKKVLFEFKSDGNLQSLGFKIVFNIFECNCNKDPIICGYTTYSLMDSTSAYYCGNLHCFYEISPCPGFILFQMAFSSEAAAQQDTFKIISDNTTIYETTRYTHMFSLFTFILNSSYGSNYLEFISAFSTEMKWIALNPLEFKVPPLDYTIILSSINSSVILDANLINFVIVKIDDSLKLTNPNIKIYSSEPYGVGLFNNESLTFPLSQEYCFSMTHFYTCTLNIEKFVILPSVYPNPYPILVLQLPQKPKGCIFNDNIFLSKDYDRFSVVDLVDDKEPCLITILLEFYYSISSLWTTAINENVQIFVGTDTSKLFFEFNAKTAKKFEKVQFLSRVYIVKIPKHSAIYINFIKIDQMETTISEHPFQTLLSTHYLNWENWNEFQTLISYKIGNYPVKFTIFEYIQKDSRNRFAFHTDNETRILSKNFSNYFIFQNQTVNFQCSFVDLNDLMTNSISFLIETIK